MGIMVYSLFWVMQDLYHQPQNAGSLWETISHFCYIKDPFLFIIEEPEGRGLRMIQASISACRLSFVNLLNFHWSLQGKAGEYLQRHR